MKALSHRPATLPALTAPLRAAGLTLALTAGLAACVPAGQQITLASSAAPEADCGRGGGRNCYFRNAPVRLDQQAITLPGRPYTFFRTIEPLDFIDTGRRVWTAPRSTLTDGASIPPLFVPVIGSPRTREFANAAALHDAYCGVGNEDLSTYHADTWQNVHRMFHDTLVVGGVPPKKARLMFAAVWLGGPRWYPIIGAEDRRMANVPAAAKVAALRAAKTYIDRNDPSFNALLLFLMAREKALLAQAARAGDRGPAEPSPLSPPTNPPTTPTNPTNPPTTPTSPGVTPPDAGVTPPRGGSGAIQG